MIAAIALGALAACSRAAGPTECASWTIDLPGLQLNVVNTDGASLDSIASVARERPDGTVTAPVRPSLVSTLDLVGKGRDAQTLVISAPGYVTQTIRLGRACDVRSRQERVVLQRAS